MRKVLLSLSLLAGFGAAGVLLASAPAAAAPATHGQLQTAIEEGTGVQQAQYYRRHRRHYRRHHRRYYR